MLTFPNFCILIAGETIKYSLEPRCTSRVWLGELKTEAFYVADAREAEAIKAKEALQKILGTMGVVVEKVLTNDYRFNPEYQKAIEDKKVADQQVEKNKSAQHAAREELTCFHHNTIYK